MKNGESLPILIKEKGLEKRLSRDMRKLANEIGRYKDHQADIPF